ncbi:MAG: cell envelope integrity protein CreD [Ponticaulis sp.]|nr:cell envelope integrity protein CreD [Ponticaulis sp.]
MSSDTSDVPEPEGFRTPTNLRGLLPQRSFGLKLLLVCALALLMAIPALFVYTVVYDRSSRAETATRAVSERYGGQQTAIGPVLIVPYSQPVTEGIRTKTERNALVLYPETGSAVTTLATEVKTSGIHEVPIYAADIAFDASFQTSRITDSVPAEATIDWNDIRLLVGLSDSRSVRKPTEIKVSGQDMPVEPMSAPSGVENWNRTSMTLLGTTLSGLDNRATPLKVSAALSFSGAERIALSPFARTTTVSVSGDWDDPKFEGGFQQAAYEGGGDGEGFAATWTIPYEARGIPGYQNAAQAFFSMQGHENTVSIRLINTASPYQSVQRALKYALMFIGFVFLAYFLFEIVSQKRAHPAQYVLVGLAQSVFYLLLLALAEQTGFDVAFWVAAAMTITLTSGYATSVFRSRMYGYRALGIFTAVYTLIYVLMRIEDFALLVGAFASFIAIGFTMYMTRNIDWYGGNRQATT